MEEKKKVAIIYDVDYTLVDEDHPNLLMISRGVKPQDFWDEVNKIQEQHKKAYPDTNIDGFYLNHISKLSSIKESPFFGLTIAEMEKVGKEKMKEHFAPGIPEFFDKIKQANPQCEIQHNLASLGIDHMIRASELGKYVNRIFAFTFLEPKIQPGVIVAGTNTSLEKDSAAKKVSRGIYHKSGKEGTEIPMQNIICIGDGESDKEMFRQMAYSGGTAICVYGLKKELGMEKARKLQARVPGLIIVPADFREGSELWRIVNNSIARAI